MREYAFGSRPPTVPIARGPACGWCGRPTEKADGVFLEAVARGRAMCPPCGRFAVECSCETSVYGGPVRR